MKVDMLDVLDIYEAAEVTSYMSELYELFSGTDVSMLSDYVIVGLLEQIGYELVEGTIRRNVDEDIAVSFCVNDYDTSIGINYESNVTVSEIIDSTLDEVTIAKWNEHDLIVEVIDLND